MPAHMPPLAPACLDHPATARMPSPGAGNAPITASLRAQGMSPIGIGCARIGSISSAGGLDEARAMLAMAAASGITLFDTAGIYGGGTSEQVVGALAGHNNGIFVMTKIGRRHSAIGRLAHSIKRWTRPMMGTHARSVVRAVRQNNIQLDFSPLALDLAVQAAQRRLGGARINALLLHSPPAETLARPATLRALESFKVHGKADWVGVSCDDLESLRIAANAPAMDVVQIPLSLYRQAADAELIPRFIEQDTAIVLRGVLGERGRPPPREAVEAAGALPGVSSVIVGVSSLAHLHELL